MFNFLSHFEEIGGAMSSGAEASMPRFHALALDWFIAVVYN